MTWDVCKSQPDGLRAILDEPTGKTLSHVAVLVAVPAIPMTLARLFYG